LRRLVITIDLTKIGGLVSRFKITHLLLLSFALHLFTIAFPSDGSTVMDEVYFVTSSRLALLLQPGPIDNPPLAQLVVAIFMKVLGDYWFAWRFPIVLTAVGSLYVFYLIAKRFMNERYALFAVAMLSFDVVFFVHGSLYYIDMPSILLGLSGMELYFARRYSWSAFSFGLSFLMKAFGLLFLGAILIYHVATYLESGPASKCKEPRSNGGEGRKNLKKFLTFLVILILVAGGGLWIYDAAYNPTTNLVSQPVTFGVVVVTNQQGNAIATYTYTNIFNATKGAPITNPMQNVMWMTPNPARGFWSTAATGARRTWDWILPIDYSYCLLPVHYYYSVLTANGALTEAGGVGLGNFDGQVYPPGSVQIDWQLEITPFVEYFFIPILIVASFNIVRKKDENRLAVLLLSWMAAGYGPFLLAGTLIPNWTTLWHYNYLLYTLPPVALGLPYFWLNVIKDEAKRGTVMLIHLAITVGFFLYFFPVPLFRVGF